MGCEDACAGCGVRRCTQLAAVGAVLVGLAAAASGTVVAGGMQVANMPSAVASTTDATRGCPDRAACHHSSRICRRKFHRKAR